jgi:hypothetical protein
MSVLYSGHVTMTYPDYIDAATGKTLVCVPGQSYNIVPASGHPTSASTSMPTDGRFTASAGREAVLEKDEEASVTEDSPAEPDDDASVS